MLDYNKNMRFQYYKTVEIEVISKVFPNLDYHFYFKNKYELLDLLKSNEKLFNELKELMKK